jgi:hypothetical protein
VKNIFVLIVTIKVRKIVAREGTGVKEAIP